MLQLTNMNFSMSLTQHLAICYVPGQCPHQWFTEKVFPKRYSLNMCMLQNAILVKAYEKGVMTFLVTVYNILCRHHEPPLRTSCSSLANRSGGLASWGAIAAQISIPVNHPPAQVRLESSGVAWLLLCQQPLCDCPWMPESRTMVQFPCP